MIGREQNVPRVLLSMVDDGCRCGVAPSAASSCFSGRYGRYGRRKALCTPDQLHFLPRGTAGNHNSEEPRLPSPILKIYRWVKVIYLKKTFCVLAYPSRNINSINRHHNHDKHNQQPGPQGPGL